MKSIGLNVRPSLCSFIRVTNARFGLFAITLAYQHRSVRPAW